MKLFIGCSSRKEIPSKYYDSNKNLLEELFNDDYDLVFGACKKGLMGLAYDIALSKNRNVIAIYPDAYIEETKELECTHVPVKTVGERTECCINESDVLIFLPGGFGTIYEIFTAIESKRAKEHNRPIIIYNCLNFYDDIINQLDKTKKEQFAAIEDFEEYYVCNNEKEVINCINTYKQNQV